MTKNITPSEIQNTHQPRPRDKTQLPFVITQGARGYITYSHKLRGLDGKTSKIPMTIELSALVATPILELQLMYCELEAQQDGYLKRIDDLTTENVMLKRQIEESVNKAVYAERNKPKGNGAK